MDEVDLRLSLLENLRGKVLSHERGLQRVDSPDKETLGIRPGAPGARRRKRKLFISPRKKAAVSELDDDSSFFNLAEFNPEACMQKPGHLQILVLS